MQRRTAARILAAVSVLVSVLALAAPDEAHLRFRLFEFEDLDPAGFDLTRDRLTEEPTRFLSVLALKCRPGQTAILEDELGGERVADILAAGGIRPRAGESDDLARRCRTKAMAVCYVLPDRYGMILEFRWESTVPDCSRSKAGNLVTAEHSIETRINLYDGETQVVRFPGGRGKRSRCLAVDATLCDGKTGQPIRARSKKAPTVVSAPISVRNAGEAKKAPVPAPAAAAPRRAPAPVPMQVAVHVELLRMPGGVDLDLGLTHEQIRQALRSGPTRELAGLSEKIRDIPAGRRQFVCPSGALSLSGETAVAEWSFADAGGKAPKAGFARLESVAMVAADLYTIDLQFRWECRIPAEELRGTRRDAKYRLEEKIRVWDGSRFFIPLGKEGASTIEFLAVTATLVTAAGQPLRPREFR